MQADESLDQATEDAVEQSEKETQDIATQLKKLTSEKEAAEARAEENWDRILRMQAEQENQRKRTQREIENAHKYGIEKFVAELLPVKDSLELGLAAADEEPGETEKIREGMELTLKMLNDVFEKFGIEVVNPEGEKFNPEHHQAMSMQENAELEPNTVMAVMQKGYLLNGRLIRPAMVMVSKAVE
ncbi:MAG TPA: nucleotide exchange factor GrpE [Chromatiales bacterium]|nr:nucleotide exchange factor GrpE [Thiotrichales bacterium]HIP68636.1 nucleotide exchange factor GrpE [Chromatiales bacterium]